MDFRLKTLFIKNHLNYDFITIDLETRIVDFIMKPYCISIYDGIEITLVHHVMVR